MKCVICKSGETSPGKITETLTRRDSTIIIKDVPAQICENCGEYYLNDKISTQVMLLAENAILRKVQTEILQFTV